MTDAPRNALLVEDNPDDEKLTIRELARAKLKNRVDVARDGQEAIDYLLRERETCRKAPPGRGSARPQACEGRQSRNPQAHARGERDPPTPVVTPTSSNEHTDVVNGYDAGANSYVCSRSGATPSPLQWRN